MDGKPKLALLRPEYDEVGAVGGIWMIRTCVLGVIPEGITAVAHVHGSSVPPGLAQFDGELCPLPRKNGRRGDDGERYQALARCRSRAFADRRRTGSAAPWDVATQGSYQA